MANLLPLPKQQYLNAAGQPLSGGKVYTYAAGTSTPQATYSDPAGVTPNTNPIILDSRGEAVIFWNGSYKVMVTDSLGNLIYTLDNYTSAISASIVGYAGQTLDQILFTQVGKVVASIAALRAVDKTNYTQTCVTGYYAAGDGGGGVYYLDGADTVSADNGGTIIVATDSGRWKLARSGAISVKQFGAKGDGTTDDTAAFNACIAAFSGDSICIPDPSVGYKLTAQVALPARTRLCGVSKRSTKIIKGFSGDLFTLADGASLCELWIDGQGATYTGRGLLIGGTDGHQEVISCRLVDFGSFCVDYTSLDAGSQSLFFNCEMNQYNAATGSTRVAVNMLAGLQVSAVPRTFIGIQTNGTPAFNFGGCNDVFVSGSFLADLIYTSNSRGVQVVNSRIANQVSMVIDGHGNTITGCDISPQVTIAANADNIILGNNSYNTLPIIDNSSNGRNQITTYRQSYTPALSSGGTQPTLGNGTLSGIFTRTGATVTVSLELTIGSTTNLGTGDLRFSLPFTPTGPNVQTCGQVSANIGATVYTGAAVIPAATAYVTLVRDTSGAITFNSPGTFAAGDKIRTTFTYLA